MTAEPTNSNPKDLPSSCPVTKENQFGDRYVEALVGTIFDSVSATAEFQRRFGKALFQEQTLYVIVGCDSGLLPQFIIKQGVPRGSRYLFIEPDEIKDCIDQNLIPDELADRIALSDETHWIEQAHDLALLNYTYSGKISYVRSCAAQQNIHPGYPSLSQSVDKDLRHLFWLFTTQFDSHVFINSQMANLAENRIPAIRLKDCFKGKSAIILGAGPSLDELTPWIKEHRHETVLIAVSRISKRLLQAEIEPDVVVSVDPQNVSFSVSKEMLNLGSRTLFVNGSHATPLLVGQWPHRNVFLGPRLPWHEESFHNFSTIAPTVTNNSILLAQEFGCSQIILTGVDLCYSAEGYTHAQGTAEHAAGPMLGKIDFTVTTNAGTEADTNKGYYEAISEISRQAQKASINGCRIINLAATASRIEGVEYIPPEKFVITNPLAEPAWKTITSLLDNDTSDDRHSHHNTIIKLLGKAARDLTQIKKLATLALKCNAKMAEQLNTPGYSKYKTEMEKIESSLNLRHEIMSTVVKSYNSSGFAKIITADSGDDWSASELFEKTKIYYEEFILGAAILLELVNDSKSRLLNRLEEESPAPDFEHMFIQWQQDVEYGRITIWKQRHPDIYETLPAEVKERAEVLLHQFDALLETDAQNMEANLQRHLSDVNTFGMIVQNAIAYHAKGDHKGLRRLSRGLSQRSEPLAVQTNILLHGLINELDNNYKKAGELYYSIDPEINADLKQIALERIVNFSIAQEDYQTTLPALKLLAEKILSYKRSYASLLALTGHITEAIEIYTQYLQQQPRDLDTMLELGMLLVDVNAREAAESVLLQIRETDPNHSGVEQLSQALQEG